MSEVASRPTLTCPKCGGAMRTYERSGITIDQCAECRGVFLDRGELERLIDAEGTYYSGGDRHRETEEPTARGPEKPKRRSRLGFLGEMFEGGD